LHNTNCVLYVLLRGLRFPLICAAYRPRTRKRLAEFLRSLKRYVHLLALICCCW